MIWLLLLGLLLVFMPTLWVRWVMKRYSTEVPDMPGTGGELAVHLIEKLGQTVWVQNLLTSGITMTPTIGWFACASRIGG